MNDDLVLYIGEKNVSSWSMRGWLAVVHKNLRFQERTIELVRDRDRARRRAVSPTGKVPVLHHGGLVIPDSLAIIEYLEETFPPPGHPPLWPSGISERSRARWMAAAMHSGFMSLREGMSFNLCFLPHPPRPPAAALEEAQEMLALFEDALARKKPHGAFLFGPFCAADILYAPAVVRLSSFKVPVDRTPLATTYLGEVLAHPPVARWLQEARSLPPRETY